MTNQDLIISTLDGGNFSAYVCEPPGGNGPGLIVIQEIFGVNAIMRQIADRYASLGYLAVVPDLFWRLEPNIELEPDNQEDLAKAFSLYEQFNEDQGVDDLIATLEAVKVLPSCSGKVGTLGFCLGGKLAYLMAARSPADCNISYYGVGIDNNLHEQEQIKTPLMLHLAELDEYVSPDAQTQMISSLEDHPHVILHRYLGVNHGFSRVNSTAYVSEIAQQAGDRTLQFLQQHLKP
ncbi:MAG: dienelactone hydrolase family protein [Roseofilum sp. SBFL]|uniref:dienelactone hydrolase family protein n=1 Tax=unclassified Roseofilum TaxID=2620099 RepID=UPI001B030BAD|nr:MULTISPECIES: dienelactone hydrolase family protein [unclassified Roseofilum]MBP0013992.1 dienelactone hydrolase family protein [Roseofilum sp. SID3]MBP0025643.1 dienelactone hydrolase family protein [Roseofilum sp. SID2]MBP0038089.1 dienelactone hydrolase family protein [Roseofilum sp. SID1]MBP0041294.1 dienelactone hydrolase family protein [Roseofilum sp. SBFL]